MENFPCTLLEMARDHLFDEVRHITQLGDKFIVNLQTQECSCMKGMLKGIPCVHVICCMNMRNHLNPKDYILDFYRKEAYEACY